MKLKYHLHCCAPEGGREAVAQVCGRVFPRGRSDEYKGGMEEVCCQVPTLVLKLVPAAEEISGPSANWGFQSFLEAQTMVEPIAGTEKLRVPSPGCIWKCWAVTCSCAHSRWAAPRQQQSGGHSPPRRHGSQSLVTSDFLDGKRSPLRD